MLIKGYYERRDSQARRDAWLLANLLQPHTKERLNAGMFLGEDSSNHQGWKQISEEEYEQLMARKRQGA